MKLDRFCRVVFTALLVASLTCSPASEAAELLQQIDAGLDLGAIAKLLHVAKARLPGGLSSDASVPGLLFEGSVSIFSNIFEGFAALTLSYL